MNRLIALAFALLLSAALSAQGVDLTGEWDLSVEVNGSVTNPTLTLVQEADTLSGTYDSETLGRARVRGTVSGTEFTIRFSASLQGQSVPVEYAGSVQEDGTLRGTIDLAGGAITGTFTAERAAVGARPSVVRRE